jgi:hypothetical protein
MQTTIGPAPPTCACRRPPPTHTPHRQYPYNPRTPALPSCTLTDTCCLLLVLSPLLHFSSPVAARVAPRTHFAVSQKQLRWWLRMYMAL